MTLKSWQFAIFDIITYILLLVAHKLLFIAHELPLIDHVFASLKEEPRVLICYYHLSRVGYILEIWKY